MKNFESPGSREEKGVADNGKRLTRARCVAFEFPKKKEKEERQRLAEKAGGGVRVHARVTMLHVVRCAERTVPISLLHGIKK